ncbi:class I SAM-dependent methyltransferase [Planctomycetota bacterium]
MTELTAANADKYELYQRSVQAPERDVDLLEQIFQEHYGRLPHSLREDFCGTAAICVEWASRDEDNNAVGIDNSIEPLAWARAHYIDELAKHGVKITLRRQNVLDPSQVGNDVIVALNYSYRIFKERHLLMRYFKSVHASLAYEGCFVIDSMGGPQTLIEYEVRHNLDGFDAIWDQVKYDPITSEHLAYLHFHFPDESRLDKAFTYNWRLWHLSELREMLREAGFSTVKVYWEDADENGEGTGKFSAAEHAAPESRWVSYLVAFR